MKIDQSFKDVPIEVLKVKSLEFGSINGTCYVGTELYKEIQDTIKKYPEYFTEETKYAKVPKEVHSAYQKELEKSYDYFYPERKSIPGEGIFAFIERTQKPPSKYIETEDDLNKILKVIEKAHQKEVSHQEEKVKIWNKHYSKYNLKYKNHN